MQTIGAGRFSYETGRFSSGKWTEIHCSAPWIAYGKGGDQHGAVGDTTVKVMGESINW